MEYKEGYYYELIEHGKSYVIRFVKKIGENEYEFHNLMTNELKTIYFEGKDLIKVNEKKEIEYSKTIPFGILEITICRISELKTDPSKRKIIFKKFIDDLIINLNKTLELSFDEKSSKYCLIYKDSSESKNEVVENDINDFFDKIEMLLDIKLSQVQKDKFLIEQFS